MPTLKLILLAVFLFHAYLVNADLRRVKRIVGGWDAVVGDFPYQVSLRTKFDDSHFCSGSILRASVILTAAHCAYSDITLVHSYYWKEFPSTTKKPSSMKIVAGSQNLATGGTEHPVTDIIVHEKFNRTYYKMDIALLIIHPPIVFSNSTKLIELATLSVNPGTPATFSGWGKISQLETKPHDHLQVIRTQVMSFSECRSRIPYRNAIGRAKICTLPKPDEGACYYDSGGPLVAGGRQIGILCCGEPCARSYPDLYTNVSVFVRWIKIQIEAYAGDND